MNHNGNHIESRLWEAADELRANSKLKSSEYSVPVPGLVFLRYADHKFQAAAKELTGSGGGRKKIGPADCQAKGVLYLPEAARFSALIQMPEGANIGAAVNDAMRAIEADNPDLKDVLPKTYNRFDNSLLKELLKTMNSVPNEEEQRGVGEQLNEEDLALFDLLTKPQIAMSDTDRDKVKAAARELPAALKAGKLVLDWRKRQQARAGVRATIEKLLYQGLPAVCTPELFEQKTTTLFQHIYGAHCGAGRSVYAAS
ncbi:MAG TPA: type I restriction-modification system subunit M N-terminal domain-containing protein [Spirochaetota bacterium]|nr:type I restriction-modification system subunit M N-terminal domain-containing protein [Spirochaetota bacterium]